MTPTILASGALIGLVTYTVGHLALDLGRFVITRTTAAIRWYRSGPSDEDIQATAARIRSALARDEALPPVTLDAVRDTDAEKRVAWGRAQ